MEEGRSAFKILTDEPTGKRTLGSHRLRLEYNVRMYLKEIGINTRLIQLRIGLLERLCECGIEPPGSISHGVKLVLIVGLITIEYNCGSVLSVLYFDEPAYPVSQIRCILRCGKSGVDSISNI